MAERDAITPNRISSYEAMSRDQLIARLKVAEDALVLIGWSTTKLGELEGSERADAAEEMWHIWAGMVGSDVTCVEANTEIDDQIPTLAWQRRAKREATLRAARSILGDD